MNNIKDSVCDSDWYSLLNPVYNCVRKTTSLKLNQSTDNLLWMQVCTSLYTPMNNSIYNLVLKPIQSTIIKIIVEE